MLSKDMPASFRPYSSAAQFAAADAPPPLHGHADALLPRAASAPRLSRSASTLLEPTAAHQHRQHRPVHVSLEETKGIVDEARRRRVLRQVGDPFVVAFHPAEPTRLLASKRADVAERMSRERAHERLLVGHRAAARASPGHMLAERLVACYTAADPHAASAPTLRRAASTNEPPSAELQKRAAMVKLFSEHDANMRAREAKKELRMYIPPHRPGLPLDRLQIERDSSRLMRKLVLRPRSHTFE